MKSINDQIRELQLIKEQIEGCQIALAAIVIAILDKAIAEAQAATAILDKAIAEAEAQAATTIAILDKAQAEVEALYVRRLYTSFTK